MVLESIVLEHKVFKEGFEVDKANMESIERLAPPTSVKGVRSFLSHAGFYHQCIKDLSKISTPLCKLFEKDTSFKFDDTFLKPFEELKMRLVTTPIITAPDWGETFELMCDANNTAIGTILGQRKNKAFHPISYANKTLNLVQVNYTVIEELLVAIWAIDKFRA